MSAKTALDLGAPIRGILAFTSTSTYALVFSIIFTLQTPIYGDKAGRSVPAPGKGALTVAREVPNTPSSYPGCGISLSSAYFPAQTNFPMAVPQHSQLHQEQEFRKAHGESIDKEYLLSRVADIEKKKRILW
jgi:fatty acid synthase subunit alpha, fungi type